MQRETLGFLENPTALASDIPTMANVPFRSVQRKKLLQFYMRTNLKSIYIPSLTSCSQLATHFYPKSAVLSDELGVYVTLPKCFIVHTYYLEAACRKSDWNCIVSSLMCGSDYELKHENVDAEPTHLAYGKMFCQFYSKSHKRNHTHTSLCIGAWLCDCSLVLNIRSLQSSQAVSFRRPSRSQENLAKR